MCCSSVMSQPQPYVLQPASVVPHRKTALIPQPKPQPLRRQCLPFSRPSRCCRLINQGPPCLGCPLCRTPITRVWSSYSREMPVCLRPQLERNCPIRCHASISTSSKPPIRRPLPNRILRLATFLLLFPLQCLLSSLKTQQLTVKQLLLTYTWLEGNSWCTFYHALFHPK